MFGINYKYLAGAAALFVAMVIIALFFQGGFLRNHFGDILVVMFIVCAIRSIVRSRMKWLCLAVFIFTTLVEIAQYFDIVGILGLTGNAWAETIIGTTFDPWDILMYAIGCAIMYAIEIYADKRSGKHE